MMRNPMEENYWEGLTVKDFCSGIGVSSDLNQTLRAIEKHNTEAVDVWICGKWIGPSESFEARSDDAIEKLRVRGIAWDDSDWEWSKVISGDGETDLVMKNLRDARDAFEEALKEHDASEGFEDLDSDMKDNYENF